MIKMRGDRVSLKFDVTQTSSCGPSVVACMIGPQRHRFGRRRLKLLLVREGIGMSHGEPRRLYDEEPGQGRRRGGHKRVLGAQVPRALLEGPNERRSQDLALDAADRQGSYGELTPL